MFFASHPNPVYECSAAFLHDVATEGVLSNHSVGADLWDFAQLMLMASSKEALHSWTLIT